MDFILLITVYFLQPLYFIGFLLRHSGKPLYSKNTYSHLFGILYQKLVDFNIYISLIKRIEILGLENLEAIYQQHQKVIICSCHLSLNFIVHYYFLTKKYPHKYITANRELAIWFDNFYNKMWQYEYNKIPIDSMLDRAIIGINSSLFFKVKKYLKDKYFILLNIDKIINNEQEPDHIKVNTNIFQLALKTKTPILFVTTELKKGKIEIKFHCPHKIIPENQIDIDMIAENFIQVFSNFFAREFRIKQ